MRVSRRRLGRVAALALLLIATVLHWRAHYAARERTGAPGPESAALLGDDAWRAVLWIAFPHQNLGALEAEVGDLRRVARELAREGEATETLALPRFGPFATPPARELAIAVDEAGNVRALARIYPAIAALARAAGTVASNPWLAGGGIADRNGSPGGTVAWDGTLWTYTSEGSERRSDSTAGLGAEGGGAPFPLSGESLAVLALKRPWDPLPPGVYSIRRSPPRGVLEIVSGSPPSESLLPDSLVPPSPSAPAGWLVDRRAAVQAWGARAVAGAEVAPDALRAMAIWTDPGPVEGLPRIAALDRGGVERYSLPGQSLVKLVGEEVRERAVAGIRVRALDTAAVERGEGFAAELARGLPDAAVLAAAAPGELEPVARGIAEKLALLAGLAERERRGFARAAAVLGLVRGCSASTLEVGPGDSFVRLVPCRSGVLDRGRSR